MVLGAGTMGSQVAVHLVACGLEVTLLDLVPEGASDRNGLPRRALEHLRKLKPLPAHLPEHLAAIHLGNFEDDLARISEADWVFEAVLEDIEVKRALFARVAPFVPAHAVVTTNTSGLGIGAMSTALPPGLRTRFLGTHFFNPPRYLKLLEVIPAPETDPRVLAHMEAFCDEVVGKAVVRAKDTPGFIANRIGSFDFGTTMKAMVDLDLTVEEVDLLTGPPIGRARSATFRTVDIAGVDVCLKVADHLYASLPHDPAREVFRLPEFCRAMVERKWLGEKTGGGFYRREGGENRTFDWKTLEYRPRRKPNLAAVQAAEATSDPVARIQQLLADGGKVGAFLGRLLPATGLYAASLVPEIAADVWSIDRAMQWGYGWGLGPFQLLDALGAGRKRFYDGVVPVPDRPGVTSLVSLTARGAVRLETRGASLLDLGDGVALVELHSKMNTIGADAVGMLFTAVRESRAHFDALVVGNQGENFSVGANLMLVLAALEAEDWKQLETMVREFQNANMALKYADVPVVAAPFGMTLGGGCEICLHSARVRLSAETYMGLVEAGVGLVPAGGGTKEMALRALDQTAGVEGVDPFPFLKRAFEAIAFGKVTTSGAEARRLFLTPADALSANPDRLIEDAKQTALGLARTGWRPGRPRKDIALPGGSALATFKMGIHNAQRGGHASEHDALVAAKVATILCGGSGAAGLVSEQHLLDLEREAFLSLLGTRKTVERIQHTLKEGKPLRN